MYYLRLMLPYLSSVATTENSVSQSLKGFLFVSSEIKFAKPRAKSSLDYQVKEASLERTLPPDSPAIINTSLIFTKQLTWPRVQEIDTVVDPLYLASGYIFQHTEPAPPVFQNTLAQSASRHLCNLSFKLNANKVTWDISP